MARRYQTLQLSYRAPFVKPILHNRNTLTFAQLSITIEETISYYIVIIIIKIFFFTFAHNMC
jgi:hypothetical protein